MNGATDIRATSEILSGDPTRLRHVLVLVSLALSGAMSMVAKRLFLEILMAQRSGGFGWFIIGVAVGAAGVTFGPGAYQKYVQQIPAGGVRVEVSSDYTPGVWRRK